MAYVATDLVLIAGAPGGVAQTWRYETTDAPATVMAAGYISNSYEIGMNVGDIVEIVQFTSSAKTALSSSSRSTCTASVADTGATLSSNKVVTATASAGAATASGLVGKITTESLTTAAGAEYTLTLTNTYIAATDIVMASVDPKTSAGTPGIGGCKANAGSAVITVTNLHASAAFDAAIQINFQVIKV